jgi:NAD(P)-dependent dehydrogenase (short-subunit alcohol dehydrogenase family)
MEIGDEEMARVYEVNVVGSLKVMQTFMPLVQASFRHPIVVNVSSPLGSLSLNRDGILAPYRCSKAALNMLTRTFALEMPSVIFLSVSPRNWNHIPSGLSVRSSTEAVEIKQDRR